MKSWATLLKNFFLLSTLWHSGIANSEVSTSEQSSLIRAAICGNAKTIEKLVAAGNDINTIDHRGYNLLMHAITSSNYDTSTAIEYMLTHGANPAQQAYDGTSTLDLAFKAEKMALASTLFRNITTTPNFDLTTCRPSISFLITDLKFDTSGNVTILEFGEGTRSYFKGHDLLYPKGLVWQNLWEYLGNKNLPMWHIGNLVTAGKESADIAIASLKSCGGSLHTSLHILEKEPAFKRIITAARKANHSPAGIVVLHHHATNAAMLNYFKTTYPEIIIVNEASRRFVNSKFMTNLLFENDEELAHFRPQCKTYEKKFTKNLADEIHADFAQHKKLVIKPIDSANGWGVIITDHKNLGLELRTILKNHAELENSFDSTYTYWLNDTNKHFIVEAFARSKTIANEGRNFDATMRQVFVVESNPSGISTTFIASYWKLPALSLSEKGSDTQRHKSNIKAGRKPSAKVSAEDDAAVQQTLRNIMPLLYKKMLQCSYQTERQ